MLLRLEHLVLIWDMRTTLWRHWDRRIPPWLVDLAFTKQMNLRTDGFSCERILYPADIPILLDLSFRSLCPPQSGISPFL